MDISAYLCPRCDTLLYSRARHDYRPCPCGDIAVDGGLDYSRIRYKHKFPKNIKLSLDVTESQLYDDWNRRHDKLGLILDYSKTVNTSNDQSGNIEYAQGSK